MVFLQLEIMNVQLLYSAPIFEMSRINSALSAHCPLSRWTKKAAVNIKLAPALTELG